MHTFLMPQPLSVADADLGCGVLNSLSCWVSSLFRMLAISMKSQHPRLHNSDPRVPDNSASLPAASVSSTAIIAPILKQPQKPTTPHTMLAVATPLLPSAPVLQGNTNVSSKRPKLSLQTSCLPISCGNSTTALSLNFSASCSPSPTVRNTFTNAYDAYRRTSSPASANRNESPGREQRRSRHEIHPKCQNGPNDREIPYQLPLGIRGILRNSPHAAASLRRASLSVPSVNAGVNGRRILFPAKKSVTYRFPLEEEIKTVRFTAKHSDLVFPDSSQLYISSSSEADTDSDSSCSSSDSLEGASTRSNQFQNIRRSPAKRKKHTPNMRQVRAAALRDQCPHTYEQDPETPQTPVQRRSKRQREWRWTLGPINDHHVHETGLGLSATQEEQQEQQHIESQSPRTGQNDACIRISLVTPKKASFLQVQPEVKSVLLTHDG